MGEHPASLAIAIPGGRAVGHQWTLDLPGGLGVQAAAALVLEHMRAMREEEPTSAVPPERTGLYLLTPDAGARTSINFWREALEVGPAMVLPGTFPWTLASAPAGFLAAGLDIRGPIQALVGGDDEVDAALTHALLDLDEGRVDRAEVVVLELGDAGTGSGGASSEGPSMGEGRARGVTLGR